MLSCCAEGGVEKWVLERAEKRVILEWNAGSSEEAERRSLTPSSILKRRKAQVAPLQAGLSPDGPPLRITLHPVTRPPPPRSSFSGIVLCRFALA